MHIEMYFTDDADIDALERAVKYLKRSVRRGQGKARKKIGSFMAVRCFIVMNPGPPILQMVTLSNAEEMFQRLQDRNVQLEFEYELQGNGDAYISDKKVILVPLGKLMSALRFVTAICD